MDQDLKSFESFMVTIIGDAPGAARAGIELRTFTGELQRLRSEIHNRDWNMRLLWLVIGVGVGLFLRGVVR